MSIFIHIKPSDTPSHTVREHLAFTRLSAAPNTSLCNLHKGLLSSSSHIQYAEKSHSLTKKIVKNIKKIYFVYPTLHIQNPESIFAINTNLFITIRINNIIQAENFHISKNSSSIFSLVKTIQIMHRNSHNAAFE